MNLDNAVGFLERILTFILNAVEFILRNIIWIALIGLAFWILIRLAKSKRRKKPKEETETKENEEISQTSPD